MKKFKKVANVIFNVLGIIGITFMVIRLGMKIESDMRIYYIFFLQLVMIASLYIGRLQTNIKLLEGKMSLAEAKLNLRITENQLDSNKDVIKLVKWIENNHDLSTTNAKLLVNIVKPKISE